MKCLVFTLLACLSSVASAQTPTESPKCLPSNYGGPGTEIISGSTYDGQYYGWWCPVSDGTWSGYGVVSVNGYKLKHPPFSPMSPAELFMAYWRLNVMAPDNSSSQRGLLQAMWQDLEPTRPAPVVQKWAVAKNGSYPTRPTYPYTGDVRSKTAGKLRATVGAPCSCSTKKIVEKASTYCEAQPSAVALCVLAP